MKRWLKRISWAMLLFGLFLGCCISYLIFPFLFKVSHAKANPDQGFHSDYFLYVSNGAKNRAKTGKPIVILVQPNNSGFKDDRSEPHVSDAWWTCFGRHFLAEDLDVALLVPTFPRPKTDWNIYTHALDKETITSDNPVYSRPDLQLIAMVLDASAKLEKKGYEVYDKILIQGFSASGMFANRFCSLHPEKVLATSSGSPGGLPILPMSEYRGQTLYWPAGVADMQKLVQQDFSKEHFSKVPQLIVMGDQDDNDSLDFGDGWDQNYSKTIQDLIGQTPLKRWPIVKQIYEDCGCNAEFLLVPGIGHDRKSLQSHTTEFFRKILNDLDNRLASEKHLQNEEKESVDTAEAKKE